MILPHFVLSPVRFANMCYHMLASIPMVSVRTATQVGAGTAHDRKQQSIARAKHLSSVFFSRKPSDDTKSAILIVSASDAVKPTSVILIKSAHAIAQLVWPIQKSIERRRAAHINDTPKSGVKSAANIV
jgi:hypothetical protein